MRLLRIFGINKRWYTIHALPYKLTSRDANSKLKDKDFLEQDHSNEGKITKKYIPFHSCGIQGLSSSFEGQYGINRTQVYYDGKQIQTKTVTDWYNVNGRLSNTNYPFGTLKTQIYAGFNYPSHNVHLALRTKDVINLRKTSINMKEADPHDLRMAYAIEKITNNLHKLEQSRVEKYLEKEYGADHVDIRVLDMHMDKCNITLHSYHIPAYILNYQSGNNQLVKIISGHNGMISGQTIYSPVKTGMIGATIGLLGSLFFIASPQYMAARFVAMRLLGGAVLGAIPAGLWAKYYYPLKYKWDKEKLVEDFKRNKTYVESDEDKKRKRFINDNNNGSSNHQRTTNNNNYQRPNYKLPEKECHMLGLNPMNNYSLEDIKHAYRKQIFKWHPDRYNGDKKLATNMTSRINDAYDVLKKIKQT